MTNQTNPPVMGDELKPCPFCGHAPERVLVTEHRIERIKCSNDDCFFYQEVLEDDWQKAVGKFNDKVSALTRIPASTQLSEEEIESLEQALAAAENTGNKQEN